MNKTTKIILGILCIIGAVGLVVYGYQTYKAEYLAAKYTNEGIPILREAIADGNMSAYKLADHYFDLAIKADPYYPWAWYNKANVYANTDHFYHYDKYPNETYIQAGLADEQKNYDMAMKCVHRFMELDPKDAPLGYQLIGAANYLYYDTYNDKVKYVLPPDFEALKGIDEIYKVSGKGGTASLLANIARTYLSMGEFNDSYKYYVYSQITDPKENPMAKYAIPEGPAFEHLVWSAIILAELHDPKVNYALANKYCHMFVDNYGPKLGWTMDLGYMPTAVSAYQLGKYDEVLKCCNLIINKYSNPKSDDLDDYSPYYGEANRYIAMVDMKKGDLEDAIKHLKENIRFSSMMVPPADDYPADIPVGYYERGLAYYFLGKYTGNKSYYELALKDFKYLVDNPNVSNRSIAHENYYFLGTVMTGCTYAKLGDYNNAQKYLKMALDELSTNEQLIGYNKYFRKDTEMLYNEMKNKDFKGIDAFPWLWEIEH
ncbi:TPR repeat-containing protein [Methanocaldococcus sp. FS406-22]|nr:TPR repeat-containing protein [Methanocaldococcus sp. FS406-22]